MMITVVSKVLGFGRELVLSYTYGASATSDAYLISLTIPSVIFSFVSAGIATAFIPMYSRIDNKQGTVAANRFTNNLSNLLIVVSSIIVAIVMVFSSALVKFFASGFAGEELELAVRFTKISVFGIFFIAALNVFSSFLRIQGNFVAPALAPFPMNLLTIAFFLISRRTSVYLMVAGTVIARASHVLLLLPFIWRTNYEYQPVLDVKDEHLRRMLFMALPVIIGTSVNEINILVDRSLASRIAIGGISALNYAARLNGFVQGIFVASITTVMYPMVSKIAAEGDIRELKSLLNESILAVCLLVAPITLGAMIFSREIVALLFGRGAFTSEAIAMTSNALLFYSIGMLPFGLRDTLSRTFYALQDTKTPMTNATIGVVLNIILNLILSRYLGIGGLALATSLSAIVATVLMFITLRRRIGGFGLRGLIVSTLKIASSSLLMGIVSVGGFSLFKRGLSTNLALILTIGLSALVYGVAIYLMQIPEVEQIIVKIRKRLGKYDGIGQER